MSLQLPVPLGDPCAEQAAALERVLRLVAGRLRPFSPPWTRPEPGQMPLLDGGLGRECNAAAVRLRPSH